jgi:sugar phosphate isomerase/epimerase
MKRKEFIKLVSTGAVGISSLGYFSCASPKEIFFKLSLAQWSLNKSIREGGMSPYLFAEKSKELGFSGLEYVNQLYDDVMKSENKSDSIKKFIAKNNQLASDFEMENVLIMIDEEGDLADENEEQRLKSIDNHKLWIDTAAEMNCSSVRLNLYGSKILKHGKRFQLKVLVN